MIHRIPLPFIHPELGWLLKFGRDSDLHYLIYERRFSLLDQSIYGGWRVCTNVDGINTGVQVFDLLGGGFISSLGCLVIAVR